MLSSIVPREVRNPHVHEATAARVMLQVFARRGIRVAFGIPGGLISSVFDALADVPAEATHDAAARLGDP